MFGDTVNGDTNKYKKSSSITSNNFCPIRSVEESSNAWSGVSTSLCTNGLI